MDHRSPEAGTPRLRGRKAVAQRKRRLQRTHGLCEDCTASGRVTIATVVDHIIPLAKGGPDTDDNTRNLCDEHHRKRTAEQFGHRERRAIGADGWPLDEG
jgi:5-methylcytosine-specific restriction enzyme A